MISTKQRNIIRNNINQLLLFSCSIGFNHYLEIIYDNGVYKLFNRDKYSNILVISSNNYMEIHNYLVETYVDIYENEK